MIRDASTSLDRCRVQALKQSAAPQCDGEALAKAKTAAAASARAVQSQKDESKRQAASHGALQPCFLTPLELRAAGVDLAAISL